MRYFTKALWAGIQPWSPECREANETWDANVVAYRKQLDRLLPRLSRTAGRFFTHHSLHDGTLLSFSVGDALDPTGRPVPRHGRRRTTVVLTVENYSNRSSYLYRLRYTGVRAVDVHTDQSLFPTYGTVFHDWGYDELVPAEDDDCLRHNVLFASGTEMSIVFQRFSFDRKSLQNRHR